MFFHSFAFSLHMLLAKWVYCEQLRISFYSFFYLLCIIFSFSWRIQSIYSYGNYWQLMSYYYCFLIFFSSKVFAVSFLSKYSLVSCLLFLISLLQFIFDYIKQFWNDSNLTLAEKITKKKLKKKNEYCY